MRYTLLTILAIAIIEMAYTQTTIGLLQHSEGTLDDGYVLFAPISSTTTYLIDKCGRKVKTWPSIYRPGQSCYLLEDGTLLRTGNVGSQSFNGGGIGGIIEKIDWDGKVTWSYKISDDTKCQHHDVRALPNGNVLVLAWELKTKADAVALGRNPTLTNANIYSEQILEIEPIGNNGGNVVWEWHLWDHMVQDFDHTKPNFGVIKENPFLININYKATGNIADWIHLNSIDYNEELDQIMVSSHNFNEIWIIDHSTSTVEAASHLGGNAGHGGDILYRWGNPQAYEDGTSSHFFGQHNAYWIPKGMPYEDHIMVFNNGNGRPGGNYSTVEIIDPPIEGNNYNTALPYAPATPSYIYNDGNPNQLFAMNISGAQQLSNGNVLFCIGPNGRFYEVDASGNTVWRYVNPVLNNGVATQGSNPNQNSTFRCTFYPYDFKGFEGKNLVTGSTIEATNNITNGCMLHTSMDEVSINENITIFPNPASDVLYIERHADLNNEEVMIQLLDVNGKPMQKILLEQRQHHCKLDIRDIANGIYFMKIQNSISSKTIKVMIVK